MKVLKKICNVLSWICFIIIIVGLLILSPMIVGYKPVVVLSGSMEPTYPVGSLIYYKHAAFNDIQKGDSITFKIDEDTLVTHRAVVKNEMSQTFETKGDANKTNDKNAVSYKNVVGKTMDFCVPVVGYIFNSSYKIAGIFVIGFILVLNIILGYVGQKEEGKKNEK